MSLAAPTMPGSGQVDHGGVDDRAAAPSDGRIGPNAVTQIGDALERRVGLAIGAQVYRAAGLLDYWIDPPTTMIPEAAPARLVEALFATLPQAQARAMLAEAGRETADYVIANRIPAIARKAFALSPSWLAARLLLKAIAKHAWTFAGSGAVTTTVGAPHRIEIADNPFATPDGLWHSEVFERMFRVLVSRGAVVRYRPRFERGGRICRFEIDL